MFEGESTWASVISVRRDNQWDESISRMVLVCWLMCIMTYFVRVLQEIILLFKCLHLHTNSVERGSGLSTLEIKQLIQLILHFL